MYNSIKTISYFFTGLALVLAMAPAAQALPQVAVSGEEGTEIITLTVPTAEPYKIFTIGNPDRMVVDVPQIKMPLAQQKKVTLPSSYDGELIKELRFGQFDKATSRFVFDLKQPVRVIDTDTGMDKNGAQILIKIEAAESGKKSARAKRPEKPVIVIDPGHGGVDPGTIAADGTQEKDVVLDYAEALREKLMKSGKYEVILTRDDDTFIMLRKRIEIARKAQGSLFISLHADSAPDNVRGLSVYTLSEQASDEEAEALAARENKSDVLADMDLSEERQDVADILISLAQRETKNRSATFADLLVVSLQSKVRLLPKTHRFAGFAVLKAPDIPSVLVELGFLSHRNDEKLLKSQAYRDKVTSGIARGVDAYFRRKKKTDGE